MSIIHMCSCQKKDHVSLGVLRLDYDYPAAVGDIDHPDTYNYDVYYKVVPGLTFEMCQIGIITDYVYENIVQVCTMVQ